jgi:predicted RNA-binding protein
MLLKNCLKEHLALVKLAIRCTKEKLSRIKPWLIAVLRELDPTVKYIAEQIESFGMQIKIQINKFLEKYMPLVVGDLGNSSKFATEFLKAVKN